MLRGTFNVAAALSLLLALTLAATWLLTHRSPSHFEFSHKGTPWRLTFASGQIRLDNQPQRRLQSEALARRVRQDLRNRIAIAEITLEQERRESPSRRGTDPVSDQMYAVDKRGHDARVRLLTHEIQSLRRFRLFSPPAPTLALSERSISLTTPIAAASLLPALRILAVLLSVLRRRSRITRQRCPVCDYDLRATPHRCPECGRPSEATRGTHRSTASTND